MPTNRISIRNMVITGFTAGDGILVEGTNDSNIYDNLIASNKNGIRLIPTVRRRASSVRTVGRWSPIRRQRDARHIQPDHGQFPMGHF